MIVPGAPASPVGAAVQAAHWIEGVVLLGAGYATIHRSSWFRFQSLFTVLGRTCISTQAAVHVCGEVGVAWWEPSPVKSSSRRLLA